MPRSGEVGIVGRNLVVCCDGTSNEIGRKLSNVLKLYRIAEKSDRQVCFYQPGIGTIAMPNSWGKWRQKMRSIFEMMTGRGTDRDVLNAYCFLARHYREGDRIFLFGFSRGAYTVRVLAGMIYLVGLLREHQTNFAGFALKAYKKSTPKDDYALGREFNETVRAQCVPIHFIGVWDTVASVIVPGRLPFTRLHLEELPFTSENPAVATFRHAIAIDERRRMFRRQPWAEEQEFRPNRYSQAKSFPIQDVRQVWFSGTHSDIGGGFVEEESALSKFPLRWMMEQATGKGLRIRRAMFNHIVLGEKRKGSRDYTKPDSCGLLHNSLTIGWWTIELFPKNRKLRDWPKRWAFLGYYIPHGEPRYIPPKSLIHTSALKRMKDCEGYAPENALPSGGYAIEPMDGPRD